MNYSKEDWLAEKEKFKENAIKAESNEYLHNLTDIRATVWSDDNVMLFKTPDNLDNKISSFKSLVIFYDKKLYQM